MAKLWINFHELEEPALDLSSTDRIIFKSKCQRNSKVISIPTKERARTLKVSRRNDKVNKNNGTVILGPQCGTPVLLSLAEHCSEPKDAGPV